MDDEEIFRRVMAGENLDTGMFLPSPFHCKIIGGSAHVDFAGR